MHFRRQPNRGLAPDLAAAQHPRPPPIPPATIPEPLRQEGMPAPVPSVAQQPEWLHLQVQAGLQVGSERPVHRGGDRVPHDNARVADSRRLAHSQRQDDWVPDADSRGRKWDTDRLRSEE